MYSQFSGRVDTCHCGQPAFFLNSQCVICGEALGYDSDRGLMLPIAPVPGTTRWKGSDGTLFWRCTNLFEAACNWLVTVPASESNPGEANPGEDPPQPLCRACELNRTIPSLASPVNVERWRRIEAAKRRMIASLLKLKLPVAPSTAEGDGGLAFDFLEPLPGGEPVTTGHADGVITLNIQEADDVEREARRENLREQYRTLVGHFRHEVGHYYWDRLLADGARLEKFRALFGDERQDYGEALQRHYQQGPPPDWPQAFISAYATSHAWEDWAETWAHYLHMVDSIDAALACGIRLDTSRVRVDKFEANVLVETGDPEAREFLRVVNDWVRLTVTLNELSVAMGQPLFYPFVLAGPVVTKLHFVHLVIQDASAIASRRAA